MREIPFTTWRKWRLQLFLIPLSAGVVVHSVALRQAGSYHFPWQLFAILCLFTFLIWEANLVVYRRLDRFMPFGEQPGRRVMAQVLWCFGVTVGIFTLLYTIIAAVSRAPFNGRLYSLYLLIALVISTIINAVYIVAYLQKAIFRAQKTTDPSPVLSVRPDAILLIESGNKILQLRPEEIAFFYSSEGLVWMLKNDGQKITTNYNAFSKIGPMLDPTRFFQLSRQYIVHRNAIRTAEGDVNRKLIVRLSPALSGLGEELVTVSRYRAGTFRAWLQVNV